MFCTYYIIELGLKKFFNGQEFEVHYLYNFIEKDIFPFIFLFTKKEKLKLNLQIKEKK